MKSKIVALLLSVVLTASISSCKKDDFDTNLGGSQSSFGEVGNTIEVGPVQGISNTSIQVSKLENGISTLSCSATSTNSTYTDLLKMVPTERFPGTVTFNGNSVEAEVNAKITDEGVQVVFNDGTKLTLVNYGAKVGDKFKATVGGVTLENEVVEKSADDDFYWGGMYIIKVRYKSHSPGILHVDHIYNHKFGLVGLDVYFEDGTVKYVGFAC